MFSCMLGLQRADGNTAAFAKVLEAFPEDNPDIDLEVVGMSGTDYTTKVKVAFAADEGPDMFEIQGLGNMEPLVTSGKILALDDLMTGVQYLRFGSARVHQLLYL